MKTTINLRIDEDLKSSLQELADQYGISLSDYLREILYNHLDYIDIAEPPIPDEDLITIEPSPNLPYEKTYEFTGLLTWLFCRYMHPSDNNSKATLDTLKTKVERVLEKSSFSHELKLEFLKVLGDLNRYLLEPEHENKQFLFPISGNHLSFNYYLLMNEIWSLETQML
ncbi:type II toxin-antitoxin system RelB/DinJ family antitoxin [Maribacter thermophilus]|uniref:type II toxin-antitoxin system RelB/DinJ family antitoxin n=1 Tax=Maribacter thermophilus TaxID=1197874 RepID=UPI0018DD2093|nr:type II toxin-antitoxin system RelB/DinJ family antitoxin [Maribacter thermophilus]